MLFQHWAGNPEGFLRDYADGLPADPSSSSLQPGGHAKRQRRKPAAVTSEANVVEILSDDSDSGNEFGEPDFVMYYGNTVKQEPPDLPGPDLPGPDLPGPGPPDSPRSDRDRSTVDDITEHMPEKSTEPMAPNTVPEEDESAAKRLKLSATGSVPVRSIEPASASASELPVGSEATTQRTRVYTSPDEILKPISPAPACVIRLNFNDSRFTASWMKHLESDNWQDELANKSFSRCFDKADQTSWKSALEIVHESAWSKWSLAKDSLPELLDLDSKFPQQPGKIPEQVFQDLQPTIDRMPLPKNYTRKKKDKPQRRR